MALPAFPSTIRPPKLNMGGSTYLPQVRTEMENGKVFTRKRFTRAREKFSGFGWNYLPEAEYQALKTFFKSVQGGSFTWTHPIENVTYTLISSADELTYGGYDESGDGRKDIVWPLEEA